MKNDMPAWFTHMGLGSWNPLGCLVSVIDDPDQAVRAVTALQAVGFTTDQIHLILAGDPGPLNGAPRRYGLPKHVFYALTNLSDDAQFEAEYRDQAQLGHPILVAHAPKHEQYSRAKELLQGYFAHTVKYYGPWVVRGLD